MNTEQILQKAIDKAGLKKIREISGSGKSVYFFKDGRYMKAEYTMSIYQFIYSHDFLKAFFGEGKEDVKVISLVTAIGTDKLEHPVTRGEYTIKWWQYHGQQMLISENPIKYLEKFI